MQFEKRLREGVQPPAREARDRGCLKKQ